MSGLQTRMHATTIAILGSTVSKSSAGTSLPVKSVEDFDSDGKSIAAYGLDSMIGAELWNWPIKEFGLDMGFQTLLVPTLTFKALSTTVGETLGVLKNQTYNESVCFRSRIISVRICAIYGF